MPAKRKEREERIARAIDAGDEPHASDLAPHRRTLAHRSRKHGTQTLTIRGKNFIHQLASNSLLDTLVFSRRLVEATPGNSPEYEGSDDADGYLRIELTDRAMVCAMVCATVPERGRENLQDLMWRNVGIARNGTRRRLSARILNLWQRQFYAGGPQPETTEEFELRNMLWWRG